MLTATATVTVTVALLLAQQPPARDTRPAAGDANGRITGVVTSDETRPRPLRRARVTLGGSGVEHFDSVITSDDGRFTFERLPPGRYTVAAAKEAYVGMSFGATRPGRAGLAVQIAAGQHVNVTLRLPRGAVITGTVYDIDGRPAPGVSVSALYARLGIALGDRQYASAAGAMPAITDDRGVYRLYGLPAGEYVLSAQPTLRQPAGTNALVEVRMMLPDNALSRTMVLSQVFHPGSADVARASRVTVRAGEERGGIDVQLEYVPISTITGTVQSPAGWGVPRVTLWRTDETADPQTGQVQSPGEQGRFAFRGVRPGSYRIAARATQLSPSGRGSSPIGEAQYAFADVVISGDDVDGVVLSMQPALSISGRVAFESAQAAAPELPPQLRVPVPAALASANGGWPMPAIMVDGVTFRISGVVPGPYRLSPGMRGVRAPVGRWWLKSIVAGGRDLLDAPLSIQQSIDDAVATFTDRASEIAGTVRDARGTATPEIWVVAFPVDRTGWFFNSRRIAAVHPDRSGQWSISNLPIGEYRVVAGDLDPNDWFDPSVLERLLPTGTPLRVTGAERQTLDLVVR